MKHIKTYAKLFEAALVLTKEQTTFLDECTMGTWSINKEGFVDINGNFDCSNEKMPSKMIRDFNGISFGTVKGTFNCAHNKLTSLKGAPQEVGGGFDCDYNTLTSLKGAPQEVVGYFNCNNNKLTSLEGAPQKAVAHFSCYNNKLVSLEGAPQEMLWGFNCINNELTSLKGGPQEIGGNFNCADNKLVSLEGAPRKVVGSFTSDFFKCPYGEWSLVWAGKHILKYPILLTVLPPEILQDKIDKDPGKMIKELKNYWNKLKKKPEYKSVEFPDNFKKAIMLAANLTDIGL